MSQEERPPEAEQEVGMVGIACVSKRQSLPKVVFRLRQRVERQRSVTGFAQRALHPAGDRADVLARGTRKLECADVVVRDHLGLILCPAERFDPLRGPQMLLGSLSARDLSVRDVTDEQMLERVLGLASA